MKIPHCYILSRRTRSSLKFDLLRFRARILHQLQKNRIPELPRLHFGCGQRHVGGWLNVDVIGSPYDIDLAAPLPWADHSFDAIVSQQVIEHLELVSEALPLFRELARVAKPRAELWLSCPDMEKVCRSYIADRGASLRQDRERRYKLAWPTGMPASQMINIMFHQGNEHRNLYDLELLSWALQESGFENVTRADEQQFLCKFPEFPLRGDDYHALYVCASKRKDE